MTDDTIISVLTEPETLLGAERLYTLIVSAVCVMSVLIARDWIIGIIAAIAWKAAILFGNRLYRIDPQYMQIMKRYLKQQNFYPSSERILTRENV